VPHGTTTDPQSRDELLATAGRFFSEPEARVDADAFLARLPLDAPVLAFNGSWLVSGYHEVCRLNAGGGVRSAPFSGGQVVPMSSVPTMATLLALMFPMMDGQDHRHLRGLAAASFSPKRIASLRTTLANCIDDTLNDVVDSGSFDVVEDLTEVLPTAITAIQMGIPTEEHELVRRWASLAKCYHLNFTLTPAEIDAAEVALSELRAYVEALCADRRRRPGADLLSDLVAAADGGDLTSEELIAYVLMMFMNGLDTLTSGLTMAVWELLQHPEEQQRVARDPRYAEAAFDESIRLHSPVRFGARFLNDDVVVGGQLLRRDEVAILFYSAANRDASRFVDPARFDPSRSGGRHLGFGHGAHHCLGHQLALMTGSIVLQRLGTLGSRVTATTTASKLEWGEELPFNTLRALPVRVASPAAARP
jgi:cytochrome P450